MPGSSRGHSAFSLAWRVLLPVFCAAACAHSLFYRSDVLLFANEGRCSHWVIDRGVFFTVITDQSFGARRAWTALGSVSRHEEGMEMPTLLAPSQRGLWEIVAGLTGRAVPRIGDAFFNLKLIAATWNSKPSGTRSSSGRSHIVLIVLWPIVLASMLPLAWFLWQTRRSVQRMAEGHCPSCGYDLRASPERCSECGTASAKPTARCAI